MPVEVKSLDEFNKLIKANQNTVVDFYADWCPPCKAIAPVYAKMADDHTKEGALAFAKVNVDHVPEVASEYGVTAMPTFMFFHDGKPGEVDAPVSSPAIQKGPGGGVTLIRGADPRALSACVTKLAEQSKSAAPTSDGAGDKAADSATA